MRGFAPQMRSAKRPHRRMRIDCCRAGTEESLLMKGRSPRAVKEWIV